MKPRLLDLFCGAHNIVELVHDYSDVSTLWKPLQSAAQDTQILLSHLRQPLGVEGPEDAAVSPLRPGVFGEWCWGRQQAALLEAVCQDPQRQKNTHLASGASRGVQGLQAQPARKRPGLREKAVAKAAWANLGLARWMLCGVWDLESSLATRRLHSDWEGKSLSPSPSLSLRFRQQASLPPSMCEPSLRADAYGSHRRNRYYPIKAAA